MLAISDETVKHLKKINYNIEIVKVDQIQPINHETFSSEDEWKKMQMNCGFLLVSDCEPPPPLLKLSASGFYEVELSGWEVVMAYRACGIEEIPAVIRG